MKITSTKHRRFAYCWKCKTLILTDASANIEMHACAEMVPIIDPDGIARLQSIELETKDADTVLEIKS